MSAYAKRVVFSLAFFALAACDEEGTYGFEPAAMEDSTTQFLNPSSTYAQWDTEGDVSAPASAMVTSPSATHSVPNAPSSQAPNSRFGVCNRYASQAVDAVNAKARDSVREVRRQNDPPHIVHAHMTIIRNAHSRGMSDARRTFDDCVVGFRTPQDIVDIATLGFSRVLERAGIPEGRVRIDASEIASGRPLGGDEALVPKAREQILGNDRGTVANIARDPIRCITFMRKC